MISSCCQIGRIRSSTSLKSSLPALQTRATLRPHSTRHLNPAPGRRVSSGTRIPLSGTLRRLSSTTRTTSSRSSGRLVRTLALVPSSRTLTESAADGLRPRKRMKTDSAQVRDKFNLSNDQHYELSAREGARQRVRQTFGQLVVEHAYPAQKLQLPFVSEIGIGRAFD
jgi:hypothetical protein